MKRSLFLLLAGTLVTAPACESITGRDDDNFSFDSARVTFNASLVNEAEVFGQLRAMQIDGLILLPNPCFTLRGDYIRTGGTAALTVVATSTNANCPAEASAMQYRLQAFGINPGPYRVRIYHQIGTAQRVQIAEDDVVIG